MGISPRHYGDLERGSARWSEELVAKFVIAVGLDRGGEKAAAVRDVLWNMLLGHSLRSVLTELTAADLLHIDNQRAPSYVSNDWWDMVYHNDAISTWFPDLVEHPGTNVLVWATSQKAEKQLLDHAEKWVRPMIAALRGAYYASLNVNLNLSDRLEHVIAQVCESPIAEYYWNKDKHVFHGNPANDVRGMLHPTEGEKIILMHSTLVSRSINAWQVTLYEMRVTDHGVLEPVPPFG